MPYFGAKHPCSAVIVQLLCNQKCDGFSDRLWNRAKSYLTKKLSDLAAISKTALEHTVALL